MLEFATDEIGPLCNFFNWYKYSKEPILVAFVAGSSARQFEEWTDEQITEITMQFLRRMFPDAPQPVAMLATRWHRDEFSHGSYSVIPLGADEGLFAELGRSEGMLFFAGEATNFEEQGTANGTYSSGIRAAAELIETIRSAK